MHVLAWHCKPILDKTISVFFITKAYVHYLQMENDVPLLYKFVTDILRYCNKRQVDWCQKTSFCKGFNSLNLFLVLKSCLMDYINVHLNIKKKKIVVEYYLTKDIKF
jgi:hypothetical protein